MPFDLRWLRRYRADVELEEINGGTSITWRGSFRPAIPGTGWFWSRFVRMLYVRCANGLADHATHLLDASQST